MSDILIAFMGFLTGLIDSIVGGGGLIGLPTLSIAIQPGAHAIGTNKIVGVTGACIALLVYARKGHMRWKDGLAYSVVCALGSMLGSELSPHVSKDFFRILMIVMCPVILWVVWNRERFFREHDTGAKPRYSLFFVAAFASGVYDGFFGPGGGTFMFLGLVLFSGYPLLPSIAISKLANTFSAATALVVYAQNGYVHWRVGSVMAMGMMIGAFLGASYATRNATKIVRPVLTFVVVLLMIKLLIDA